MRKNNIDVFMGSANLSAGKQINIAMEDGSEEILHGEHIIIATGAYSFTPPAWEPDGEKVISYTEAILQEKLPASVVIIGAGAIGVEFSTIWNSYGTEVHLVEMLPTILPLEDPDVSSELEKAFKKSGINVLAGHKVESVKKTAGGVSVVVSSADGEKTINAEQALVAIGFRPNTTGMGLDTVGVDLDEKGFIKIDEKMATNVPGIWAIGDVTGKLLLAHVASKQAILCADAIAGKETQPINYQMVPSATYCHPQVASFGMTEAEAVEAGREVKVGAFPFMANGKALGLGETTGFAKIVVDAKYGEILGASLIGPEVSELLPELTLAQKMEMTIEEVAHNIHAHPTLSESLMEAAEVAIGTPIHI